MSLTNIGKFHQWEGKMARNQPENLTDEEFSKEIDPILGSVREKVEQDFQSDS